VLKEGEKLADILSMPVKDALGRDVEVNYESDIANVLELLDATVVRKNAFCDSVELRKLTLAQVAHVRAYERDAAQAVQWLDDLFQVSRYPSLCSSVLPARFRNGNVKAKELTPSRKADSSSASQEIPALPSSNSLLHVPILNPATPVHHFLSYLYKFPFKIILPFKPRSSKASLSSRGPAL
jgi:hypothetical protein